MAVVDSTLKGAGAGAAIGSVVPGIGTVAGGVIGGVIGGVGSYLSTNKAPKITFGGNADQGQESDFTFGSHNDESPYAQQYSQYYGGLGSNYLQQAGAVQGNGAPQISGNAQDRNAQLAAYQNTTGAAGQLGQNAGYLTQMGLAPTNTGIAAAQLQQGQNQAAAQNLAMAHSGRTLGSGAASLQQAQFQNAQSQQATNEAAATANLQEQQQNKQMQISALGAAQQGYGAQAGAYGAAGSQAGALNAADTGLQAQNAGYTLGQEGLNNQLTGTYGQMGLNEQGMANQVLSTQLGADEQYSNLMAGNSIAQQGLNNQQTGMALGAASAAIGAYGQYAGSDRDVKQGIMPAGAIPDSPQQAAPAQTPYISNSPQQAWARYLAQQQNNPGALQASSGPAQPWVPPHSANYAGQQTSMASANAVNAYGGNAGNMQLQSERAQQAPSAAPGGYGTGVSLSPQVGQGQIQSTSAYDSTNPYGGLFASNNRVASDVNNKRDIKPADDDGFLSHMLWHGGFKLGGGNDASSPAATPPAIVQNPNNPSQMISPFASIGAASNSAHASPAAPRSVASYGVGSGPDDRAKDQIAQLQAYAPATQDTWGGAPAAASFPADNGPPPAPWLVNYMQGQGVVASDVHSKEKIQALSDENEALRASLNNTGPTRSQLNRAASDQDAGGRIVYPASRPGPTPAQLSQAVAAQAAAYGPQPAPYGPPPPPMASPQPPSAMVAPGAPPAQSAPRPLLNRPRPYAPGSFLNNLSIAPVASDQHSKSRIQELEGQLAALKQPDTNALDAAYRSQGGTPNVPAPAMDLRPAQGYSYEYKDPSRFGQGRFYGPMAQDLEKTPAGASVVKQAPDGTKMVDTSRLPLVNTAAISELQRKEQERAARDRMLDQQLAALRPQNMAAIPQAQPGLYPSPQGVY